VRVAPFDYATSRAESGRADHAHQLTSEPRQVAHDCRPGTRTRVAARLCFAKTSAVPCRSLSRMCRELIALMIARAGRV
jgi:hypothetical protein